jgi:hypothetical protein
VSDKEETGPGYLSPQDMQSWLVQEIKDAAKAFELRMREATGFVTKYALGELTAAEADEHHCRYYHRWGESLPGLSASETVTDEMLLAAMDKAAESVSGPYVTPAKTRARYTERFRSANKNSR